MISKADKGLFWEKLLSRQYGSKEEKEFSVYKKL